MRTYLRQVPTAVRMLLVLTMLLGVIYPLVVTAVAQLPGLRAHADGSLLAREKTIVGSSLLGQDFAGARRYFQSRPSAGGYDPTASGASNLGPESVALLNEVCKRSYAIGRRYGVDGSRPFCTSDGAAAVLAVFADHAVSVNQACPARPFIARFRGLPVRCAARHGDYSAATFVPVRGDSPAKPAVPPDAVTASASGLDPNISPAYARLQEASVARARRITLAQVAAVVAAHTYGRDLGFLGEPRVNVLEVNLALDREYPAAR